MEYALSTAVVAGLILASIVAGVTFPTASRLPMQWGFSGKPTWYASRVVALGFVPVVAMAVLAVVMLLGVTSTYAVGVIAVAFAAAHGLYLAMVYDHLT